MIVAKTIFFSYLQIASLVQTGLNSMKRSCVTVFMNENSSNLCGLIFRHISKLYTKLLVCFKTARILDFAFQRAVNQHHFDALLKKHWQCHIQRMLHV